MRLHYLQHVPLETPGSILSWAREQGHTITRTLLYADEGLPGTDSFDWLVIMGGSMNVYEEDLYPWLVREKAFIREAIGAGKVILGFCLGGQLIADAIGGKVTRNDRPEFGWCPIRWSAEARSDPLFTFFPPECIVFQWHGDTFSVLPSEAIMLARSEVCEHQAFAYRERVFGFQFHLENTPEMVRAMVEECADDMGSDACDTSSQEMMAHPEHFEQNNLWMSEFLTRLAARGRERKWHH
ncbi:MAG: type 1 glutamine amidotransferase [Methanomassiliicoccus sp.]|nr:type 1 glutamine amidotransferase [Methanomassiliicoccus sp.]